MGPSVELEQSYLKTQAFSSGADGYGRLMSNVFQKPNISNKKPSILIANPGFDKKTPVFQIKKIEILGFSHIEFEIIGILSEMASIQKNWYFNQKAGTKKIITRFFYKQSFF